MKKILKKILIILILPIYIFLIINSNVSLTDTIKLIYSGIVMPYWLLYTFGFIILLIIVYMEINNKNNKNLI